MREKHNHTSGGWRKKGWLRDVETFDLGLWGWVGKMGRQARGGPQEEQQQSQVVGTWGGNPGGPVESALGR